MKPVAVYVHTPFCPSKCGYCDFNSYAMTGEIVERTVSAIESEILRSPWAGRPAKTIFFGGGTPTFLESGQLVRLLGAVRSVHPPVENCEITSEANPGTVDMPKFEAMFRAGFNRISLGAQSFLDSDLLTLGRVHRAGHIERAVSAARDAGFSNLNLDLMFALPDQSARAWRENLRRAIGLRPEHISLYCLTIEPSTPFYKLNLHGKLNLPDDESQVTMYDECIADTLAAGYGQYEISNFSLPGRECAHNLCYWHGEEYAAYGPGAVGAMEGVDCVRRRYINLKHPDRYCTAVETGDALAFETETLTDEVLRTERIMLGLRLNDGIAVDGLDLDLRALAGLRDRGWVDASASRIKLSPAGRHFHNEVAAGLI